MLPTRSMILSFPAALAAVLVFAIPGTLPAQAQKDAGQIDELTVKDDAHRTLAGLTMRVRLKAITPAEPSEIQWRYGGEAQGGQRHSKGEMRESYFTSKV